MFLPACEKQGSPINIMAKIQLINVCKRWGDVVGVENFNLEIKEREFIVLLGPSGCGKTTTMRMIAGLEDPSAGEIYIDGRPMGNMEPKDRDIAMVFQNYGLYPNLSVYENIRFPLKVRKTDFNEQDGRVRQAAARVELDALLERKPRELSGGQRQRVALARAIVRRPSVFLMDEPLSNLDAKLRMSTRAEIKNLHRELDAVVVYVTHDQVEAMTLADRIVLMNNGHIQQTAPPIELYDSPANTFAAGFIGSPPMNLIDGEIENGVFSALGTRISGLPGNVSGAVTLGVRAEDLTVVKEDVADIHAPVYNVELLGDCTLVTVKNGDVQMTAKAGKTFHAEIGATMHLAATPQKCRLFSRPSGERIGE